MKFKCTVSINASIEQVVLLFDNVDNLHHWQEGFISHKYLAHKSPNNHSKARLVYKMGGKPMELIETIHTKNLPEELFASYEHIHMDNTMLSSFVSIDDKLTRFNVIIEYTVFHSFLPKMMAKFFPGMFRKQTQKWLDNFKIFVESESSKD
jgi:uncharacterized membrane protein